VDEGEARATIARRLRTQGRACEAIGSPLYAGLLERAAQDVERGGVTWDILAGHEDDPGPSALALRLLGAVHRVVLKGEAPELAAIYRAGDPNGDGEAWSAFERVLTERRDHLREEVDKGVQTNEVGRAGALAPAFLVAARDTGMHDVRVLEIGASGGLNLRWDAFGYRHRDRTWGDTTSPVQLGDPYEEGTPPFDVDVAVVARAGCDPNPIDVTTDDGARTLMSFVWPDQQRRFDDLRGAIEIARRVPATVERAEAAPWVARRLAEATPGVLTIVYHSVVMQYLTEEGRGRFVAEMERAGGRATSDEPTRRTFEVSVTTWPGGVDRVVAETGAHGRPVRWLG
jgi:hypothetical protein